MNLFARLDSRRWIALAIVLAAVLFLCINILANFWLGRFRLDATEGGSYTVTKQIQPVFASIGEPITVRLYYSQSLTTASPQHAALYRRIRELLAQYTKISNGKITVEYNTPEPFSDTEDRALGFGLQAVPLGNTGEVAYFGAAATNSVDEQQVIPFFNLEREQFVEYDLAKLIYSLSHVSQAKVGLISSLNIAGGMDAIEMRRTGRPSAPWAVMSQIKDFFEVQEFDGEVAEIPKDISLLMLVQPTNLSPATQFAIDQFVLRGGRVLLFVDPNPEAAGPLGGSGNLEGIKKLMTDWGVSLVDGKVVGDIDSAIRVGSAGESGGDRPVVSDYVAWIQLGVQDFDRQDAIIGDVKQLTFGTAGALEKVAGATTTVMPLILTGVNSMRIDVAKVQGMPDIVSLFRDFKPSGKAEAVAVRISGPLKTAFPEGPPTKPSDPNAAAPLQASAQPAQIVVVADTDMLTDRFWTQASEMLGQRVAIPTADNAAFVVNAIENMTGAPALSALRGRGVQSRPFLLVDVMRRKAEIKFRAKEKALEDRLEELQGKLKAIQNRQGSDSTQLSDADRNTIDNYRGEILSTRHDLRDVQGALRRDIDRLEAIIKFVNIALVPILFGAAVLIIATLRRRRAARARNQRPAEATP
jgi:ABC-type uncharacterized transport system involved in gliding motility auxiliary subunit